MIKRLQPTRLTNHHERNVKPILDLSSGDFPMIDAFIAYFAGSLQSSDMNVFFIILMSSLESAILGSMI